MKEGMGEGGEQRYNLVAFSMLQTLKPKELDYIT